MAFPWDAIEDFHLKSDTTKMEFWIDWKNSHPEEWRSMQRKWNFSDIDSSPWDTYEIAARIVENEWREKECKFLPGSSMECRCCCRVCN